MCGGKREKCFNANLLLNPIFKIGQYLPSYKRIISLKTHKKIFENWLSINFYWPFRTFVE